jgi:hypothetical protein
VKTSVQERQDAQAHFTVVAAGILRNECGFPIEFGGERKGQAALGYVLVVPGRVEGKTHPISCYSNNCILSRIDAGSRGARFENLGSKWQTSWNRHRARRAEASSATGRAGLNSL